MNHSTSFNLLGKAGHQPIQPLLLFVSLLIDFVKPVFNSFCYSHCYRRATVSCYDEKMGSLSIDVFELPTLNRSEAFSLLYLLLLNMYKKTICSRVNQTTTQGCK